MGRSVITAVGRDWLVEVGEKKKETVVEDEMEPWGGEW